MTNPINETRAALERAANTMLDVRSRLKGRDLLNSGVAEQIESIKRAACDALNAAVALQDAQRREAWIDGRAVLHLEG
jgi:hypothetical protein